MNSKIEEENQVVLLLTSLQPSCDTYVTVLLVGKEMLKIEGVKNNSLLVIKREKAFKNLYKLIYIVKK